MAMQTALRIISTNRIFLAILSICMNVQIMQAATGYADSAVFPLDARDTIASVAVDSNSFALETRARGNVGTTASGSFALNTTAGLTSTLTIVGPSSVLAGSRTPYLVLWQAGGAPLDVTANTRWRFIGSAPRNTGMVPPDLFAGETTAPATATLVASYANPNGVSYETAPFVINIQPRLTAAVTTTATAPGVIQFTANTQGGAGALTINWDLDGDTQFDDATGPLASIDFGTWTGTTNVTVEVIDGTGKRWTEVRSIVLNKPPVANQPINLKPRWDIGGASLHLPNASRDPFVFNAGEPLRNESGLIVIVHGLYTGADAGWMGEMGRAIEERCRGEGIIPPNLALMDWSGLARDPSELPTWMKDQLAAMILLGIKTGNGAAVATGTSGELINFGFDLYGVREFGLSAGQFLANWIYLNSLTRGGPAQIDRNKPIHLIGHSAGGFVVGEAARILKHPDSGLSQIFVDRISMLDTPFVYRSHVSQGAGRFPNPGTAERYVSSMWGSLTFDFAGGLIIPGGPYSRLVNIWSSVTPLYNYVSHGRAYAWYTDDTVRDTTTADGFALSPIINPSTRVAKTFAVLPGLPVVTEGSPAGLPDMPLSGWQTFGTVSASNNVQVLTEHADAGLWLNLDWPATATTLKFEFRFLFPGDGDFLAVHAGDLPVLYQGLDLDLARDGWISAEIPVGNFPTNTTKLVFTLVSRGATNAVLGLRDIRLGLSDDPDEDGLNRDQEALLGTNPRSPDSDADGLADGEEALNLSTSPLQTDSDGDGVGDLEELRAGTSPIQAASVLRVSAYALNPQATRLEVRWPSVAGKSYTVFRSQEVGTGNFHLLTTGVAGTGAQVSFVDEQPPTGPVYYWVTAE